MKEIKGYTPSPWTVVENHPVFDGKKIIAVKDELNSNSFRDKYILVCELTDIRGDSFTDNSKFIEANAELIAAAPELYEENARLREQVDTLKKALGDVQKRSAYLDNGVNGCGDKQISDIWSLATAAMSQTESAGVTA